MKRNNIQCIQVLPAFMWFVMDKNGDVRHNMY